MQKQTWPWTRPQGLRLLVQRTVPATATAITVTTAASQAHGNCPASATVVEETAEVVVTVVVGVDTALVVFADVVVTVGSVPPSHQTFLQSNLVPRVPSSK